MHDYRLLASIRSLMQPLMLSVHASDSPPDQRSESSVRQLHRHSLLRHGAFKLALRKPDQYAAAASLSGALDMSAHMDRNASSALQQTELQRIFGPEVAGTENDTQPVDLLGLMLMGFFIEERNKHKCNQA